MRRFPFTRVEVLIGVVPLAFLVLACGDYSGGAKVTNSETEVVGGGGLGGLSAAEQVAAFEATVNPLLQEHCSDCHAGSGPGTPHIAHPNPATAYSALVETQKVNFTNPSSSRIVRRLATDFHYCWSNCVVDGAEMLAQVTAWDLALEAAGVEGGETGVDVETIVSGDLFLADGVEDLGETRDEVNVIARYDFKEGSGPTAFDSSGVAPAMNLTLFGAEWMSSYGIKIPKGKRALADRESSRKLFERIGASDSGTGEYSIEVWVTPANTTQNGDGGPARIVTYSRNSLLANFALGQQLYQYVFRNRSVEEETTSRGDPALITYAVDEDLQDRLQHVVATYDRFNRRMLFVDGVFTDDLDDVKAGRLWNWDDRSQLSLGNEVTGGGQEWVGDIRFLAIYDKAIPSGQILQNFKAGVGKRLTLSFDVSDWAGADSIVDFAVTQLDDYSYLFCQPTFRGPNTAGLRVEDIRIQVNDSVPVEGQAFSNVEDTILEDGQQVSRQCSVIRTELGPEADNFKVVFRELGRFSSPETVNASEFVVSTEVLDPVPVLGIRNFSRVLDTMSTLTGVNAAGVPQLRDTYVGLRQQLPGTVDVRSFVSSQQIGIAKLAFEFCHELVEENVPLRTAFFGSSFQFGEAPDIAFDSDAKIDMITNPLIRRMVHYDVSVELADQASATEIEAELDQLIDELSVCTPGPCDADRTINIVKGACTAVLSSAGVMIH